MLNFWYSAHCTREVKLIMSIATCAIIYYCSSIEKLSAQLTMICLLIGVVIHLLHVLSLKIAENNPYAQGFKILFSFTARFKALNEVCKVISKDGCFFEIIKFA